MEIIRFANKGDHYRVVARVKRRYAHKPTLFKAIAAALPEASRFSEIIALEYVPGHVNRNNLYVIVLLA